MEFWRPLFDCLDMNAVFVEAYSVVVSLNAALSSLSLENIAVCSTNLEDGPKDSPLFCDYNSMLYGRLSL